MNIRWKVACINWSHPDAPHAVSYALRDGEMVADQFHTTWDDAMERANWWAARTALTAKRVSVGSRNGGAS